MTRQAIVAMNGGAPEEAILVVWVPANYAQWKGTPNIKMSSSLAAPLGDHLLPSSYGNTVEKISQYFSSLEVPY